MFGQGPADANDACPLMLMMLVPGGPADANGPAETDDARPGAG